MQQISSLSAKPTPAIVSHLKKPKKISRTHRPEDLSLEEWQIALRRDFGREQDFEFKNIGEHAFFSEFLVTNPQTKGTYRVAIRGLNPGDTFCSCPDFSTNTLGTCKHAEFTLAKLKARRGGGAAFRRGFQPEYSEIYLRYGAQKKILFRQGTECPKPILKLAGIYFDEQGILKPEAYFSLDAFLQKSRAHAHELRCYEDALSFMAQVRDQASLKERIRKLFPQEIKSALFQNLLKVPLYPYQREGALFAAQAGRSLIADDMGLGKTIQAIAAAEILAKAVGVERVLVITPTSLKHHWKQEIEKFTRRTAEVVEGITSPKREAKYKTPTFFKITNYDVVHRDLPIISHWSPDLIILDEAQRIKNWKTRTAQSVKKLQSPYTLVLTGTPLENRLEELHSIVEFVDRHRLGPTFRFLADHQELDEAGKVVGYKNLSRISETLKPILLRRTKAQVLKDLPKRLDKHFFLPMTPQQIKHHEENADTVARIVAKWRRYKFLSETDQRVLMIALQNMRMSCNSTYLLDHKTDFGTKADELMTLLEEVFEDPQAKAVIFSQWTRTHEILQKRLEAKKWEHVLFHGGVPGPKRKDLIRRFKEEPQCRLFLSTDAGGVGLNLQHASVVVNMDQPWNPAVLEQRIGRVHRLGQTRPVRVFHFVAQGTIEHGMLDLLAFKKSLFTGVLDSGADTVSLGGSRLKRFMESVEKATGNIPEPMPSDEKKDESELQQAPAGAPQQAWAEVFSSGMDLLDKLGKALNNTGNGKSEWIVRDENTGTPHFKIPIPKPEALQKIGEVFNQLARVMGS